MKTHIKIKGDIEKILIPFKDSLQIHILAVNQNHKRVQHFIRNNLSTECDAICKKLNWPFKNAYTRRNIFGTKVREEMLGPQEKKPKTLRPALL